MDMNDINLLIIPAARKGEIEVLKLLNHSKVV
jgi:hypothetical protein